MMAPAHMAAGLIAHAAFSHRNCGCGITGAGY